MSKPMKCILVIEEASLDVSTSALRLSLVLVYQALLIAATYTSKQVNFAVESERHAGVAWRKCIAPATSVQRWKSVDGTTDESHRNQYHRGPCRKAFCRTRHCTCPWSRQAGRRLP